jgi:hypothetical protein
MTVFWDFTPCSLVEVYRCFRGAWRLHHQGDEYAAARCLLIALMMEPASTSETSENFYQTTRRIIPADSYLQNMQKFKIQAYRIVLLLVFFVWVRKLSTLVKNAD